ncbi:OmpP1/FadL family transporter [Sulfuriroseicoccus oceanibius]|uniref:Outer membrane protein transport protein n=1 Tax=Sulfuriroseicoccus oceanibius TaxID=2707525 RepID=A0A6B3L9G9_9BACT|nr:outer membrane protein transport protein [Sulfuriroseicoccus oceanibius]QQL45643.1 outer membrane protein transport protein [Sulfuriroseicoccus oceanibius]
MNYKSVGSALTVMGLGLVTQAYATNGVNLIGIGPVSRAQGGTGVAAPQDAVSAVFSNPAAMCISESCSSPQVDLSLTTFMPSTSAKMSMGPMTFEGDSDSELYYIPALGVSLPVGGESTRWRAGMAIYGISGLGVDYEDTAISSVIPFDFTELQIMKMAPSVAYSVTPDLSIGASVHVNYASLEIGSSTLPTGKNDASDWAMGVQLGATWTVTPSVTLGVTYITEQENSYSDIMPEFGMMGPTGALTDFDLSLPQQVGVGVAWTGLEDRLTLSTDGRWVNWADADGYSDFGWEDQWTVGVGAQYEVIDNKLTVRAGYNYGKNPLRTQSFNQDVMSIIGFPAIVEHHLGLGLGYQINKDFVVNIAWVHAFENTMSSATPDGMASIESSLSEDTIDVGLTWRF